MAGFGDTYLGRLRRIVGDRLILMPGARIVIEAADGRILLQHRADFGLWGLPGGNAEDGESLASIIAREVEEEVGLVIPPPVPFGFASDPAFETVTYPNGHKCQFFVMLFHTDVFEGEPRVADDESYAVGWFDVATLPEMLPNMRRTVEAYRRFQETGAFQMI
ncbi:NUDIX domain-containing protein [Phenylobacterium sp.]|uniref:NUDIX domain-containing protein n=1 Tax=Phenylobacterium sp. TaxID=1871053 RepID=UPI0035B116B1